MSSSTQDNQPQSSPTVKWWEPQYGNTGIHQTEEKKIDQNPVQTTPLEPKAFSPDQYVEMTEKIVETIAKIIKKIIASPFVALRLALKSMFSFETYWLWQIGLFVHFLIQVAVMGIIFFGDPKESIPLFINSLLGESYDGSISFGHRLILAVIAFIIIRVIFELFLIILSINDSLGKIRDSIIKKSPEEQ